MKYLLNYLRKVFSASLIEPIVLVSLYIGFLYLLKGALPTSDQLLTHIASLYDRYGYEILFLGAVLESLIIVNLVSPGMIALAFGGVFARAGNLDLTIAILASVAGAMFGYMVDFFIGLFGFSKIVERLGGIEVVKNVQFQLRKNGIKSCALGFFHPNMGSLISLVAGTIGMKFVGFVMLSFLSTLAWFSLWGLLVYILGDTVLIILKKYFFILGVLISSVWLLMFISSRRKGKLESSR